MLADYGKQLPVLAEWMRARGQDIAGVTRSRVPSTPVFHHTTEHHAIEEVLATLWAAAPTRLAGKHRVFRSIQCAQELRNLASELSFAARLARHDVRLTSGPL
jgi:hypothetical protein